MNDWRIVYLLAGAIPAIIFTVIVAQALWLLQWQDRLKMPPEARNIPELFITVIILLATEILFWSTILFGRDYLPPFFQENLTLAYILLVLRTAATSAVGWWWWVKIMR